MTNIFDESGNIIPVTVINAGPCTVTQVKTTEKDGYSAVQMAFGEKKKLSKPLMGHLKAAKASARKIKEFKINEDENFAVGDKLTVEVFNAGDKVNVTGVSKGKGFTGTIKRHNFKRGPKTHGSHNYRAPGSIGAGYPEHVFRGQKLPGQMGATKSTVKNVKIVSIDKDKNLLVIAGAIPGPNKSFVIVKG